MQDPSAAEVEYILYKGYFNKTMMHKVTLPENGLHDLCNDYKELFKTMKEGKLPQGIGSISLAFLTVILENTNGADKFLEETK